MTVQKLIDKLKDFAPDREIRVADIVLGDTAGIIDVDLDTSSGEVVLTFDYEA